ncbi:MAG TPA: ferrous iron transport protein B, partial [Methanomicrobiales archaeon]|nr:ferrous iron transport protein B [Methanomicrobiales archaeon]
TTVALHRGSVCYKRERLEIIDLPGVYSIDGATDEERMIRKYLSGGEAEAAIVVINATRLERNLYLLLQVAEYGIPLVIVLNMMDEVEARGLEVDTLRLSEIFGVEVLATAASQGRGIEAIIPTVLNSAHPSHIEIPYDYHIESAIRSLEKVEGAGRIEALWALLGISNSPELQEVAGALVEEIERTHQMTVQQIIAANRHHFASQISLETLRKSGASTGFDVDRLLTKAIPGIPILIGILLLMLLTVFVVGSFLEGLITEAFNLLLIQPVSALVIPDLAKTVGVAIALALQAGFGIAFPYVLTFYILLAVLEDSGYMTRAAFLADKVMHQFGLHGEAVIPLVLAFGCNVPAIMGTRNLKSRRERIIAATMVTMVPCSARTVIITGIVAAFIGIPAALSIYLIVLALVLLTGLILSRAVSGERFGMILEMAILRRPDPKLVLEKSWLRLREFLFIAMPLLIAGSIVLGLLEFYGILAIFQEVVSPLFVGLLGLPPYAATALLFGILRKEMAFETLAVLAGTADLGAVMTNLQLYIFALVSVLFIPCISTIAVLSRELNAKVALMVSIYTVALGLAVGALIAFILGG